jgi:adenine-specific DNA-methyltransferase
MKTDTQQRLDRYEDWLWALTATELADCAQFDPQHGFVLRQVPRDLRPAEVPLGRYRLKPPQNREELPDGEFHYRPGHPLAEGLVSRARERQLPPCELQLDYARRQGRVMVVEQLQGQSGWMQVEQLQVTSLDQEQSLLLSAITDDGQVLDRATCEKLLTIPATVGPKVTVPPAIRDQLEAALQVQAGRVIAESQRRNEVFFDAESDKLDRWADDLKENLERELKNLEAEIREAKKGKAFAGDLQSKIAAVKRINELEQQRNQKKRTLYEAQDQIEQRKDSLIDEVEARLQQQTSRETVFTIRWNLA